MIVRRQLAPGTQIRQVELAAQLGLSRSPLRQALSALETEGLVTHEQQRGYFVARMSVDHLSQIYRMRELLETELLRTGAAAARRAAGSRPATTRSRRWPTARWRGCWSPTGFHFGSRAVAAGHRQNSRLWNTRSPTGGVPVAAADPPAHRPRARAMLAALARGEARLVRLADRTAPPPLRRHRAARRRAA